MSLLLIYEPRQLLPSQDFAICAFTFFNKAGHTNLVSIQPQFFSSLPKQLCSRNSAVFPTCLNSFTMSSLCRSQFDEKSGSYAMLSPENLYLIIKTRSELSKEWMSLVALPTSLVCLQSSTKSGCSSSFDCRKAAWYRVVHESRLAQEWATDLITEMNGERRKRSYGKSLKRLRHK